MLYTRDNIATLPLVFNVSDYGEVKVYSETTNSNTNSVWWAGTGETNKTSPYKLKVTNTGKMLVVNKNNLGYIYKKVRPTADISENINIRFRLKSAKGDMFLGLREDNPNGDQPIIIINQNPLDLKTTNLAYSPSNKYLHLAFGYNNNIVCTNKGGNCSEPISWGIGNTNNSKITWDDDGYVYDSNCNKYLWFFNGGDRESQVFFNQDKITQFDIIYRDCKYETIPTDSDSEDTEKTGECGNSVCPVDCVVSDWGDWSNCSSECNGGTRKRTRQITTNSAGAGAPCASPLEQTDECNKQACPSPSGGTPSGGTPSGGGDTNSGGKPSTPSGGGDTNGGGKPSTPSGGGGKPSTPSGDDTPAPSSDPSFLEKYKWWLVGGSITFFFIIIIIMIIVLKKKKSE
jgi:hypothetical protein